MKGYGSRKVGSLARFSVYPQCWRRSASRRDPAFRRIQGPLAERKKRQKCHQVREFTAEEMRKIFAFETHLKSSQEKIQWVQDVCAVSIAYVLGLRMSENKSLSCDVVKIRNGEVVITLETRKYKHEPTIFPDIISNCRQNNELKLSRWLLDQAAQLWPLKREALKITFVASAPLILKRRN